MKNTNFYINPYGTKRKQEPNQLLCFLLSFVIGALITTEILCIIAQFC